jgi:trimeric autotransporter adhesin
MQPATLRRFFVSTQTHFRKTQLAIALTAALTAGAAFADPLVINNDVQVVGDNTEGNTFPNVMIGTVTTTTKESPAPGAPEVTLPSVPSGLTTVIYTVTGDNASVESTTVATGGATVDNNGNVKLSGGYTETQSTTFDLATRVVINSDPAALPVAPGDPCTPANFGCVISSTPNVVGTWSGTSTGTFTEGMPEPDESVKDVQPGGNLDMTGNLTVGGSVNLTGPVTTEGDVSITGALGVTGATTTAGITNTGGLSTDTITANQGGSITAVQTDSKVAKGLTVNAAGASLTGDTVTIAGGTGTTTVTVNNSGVTVNDSANGQTFQVSNVGDATVARDLGVGRNASVAGTLTVTGATTLNGATTVNNTLNVTGATTTAGITNNGTLTNNGNAVFTGVGGTRAVQINSGTSTRALDVNGAMHVSANSGNTTLYADANGVNATGNGASLEVNGGTASLRNSSGSYVEAVGSSAAAYGNGASMYVNGTYAELHNSDLNGLFVESNRSQLYGGTASSYSSLTLDGAGAAFAGPTGQPVRVTGVADGKNKHDAVNKGQLDEVDSRANAGVAAAVALAGIPSPAAGKQYSVGVGWGNYEGENAFALGGKAQVTPEFQLSAGWGYSNEGNAFNIGAGYSW